MEKKDNNPIRVDTTVQKDLPSIDNYFDYEIGEIPGAEDVLESIRKRQKTEAEKIIDRYEKNDIQTI